MKLTLMILGALTASLINAGSFNSEQKGQLQMNHAEPISSTPEYACMKTARKIELTGKLDDPMWLDARAIKLHDAVSGNPGRFTTKVRILYDDDFLYVGFHCEDTYVWGTVTERDGPIWNEECVEVFVNPANVAHQYYEINLSPKNIVYDSVILNRRTVEKPDESFIGLPEWNAAGLRTATHIDGEADAPGKAKGWSAELAIPIAELIGAPNVPPRPGDVWRINFYRIDSPKKGAREHYAWSQTGREAFHLPWRFGTIRFE